MVCSRMMHRCLRSYWSERKGQSCALGLGYRIRRWKSRDHHHHHHHNHHHHHHQQQQQQHQQQHHQHQHQPPTQPPTTITVRICALNLLFINIFHDIVVRIESRRVNKAKHVLLMCSFFPFCAGKTALAWKVSCNFPAKIERINRPTIFIRHVSGIVYIMHMPE